MTKTKTARGMSGSLDTLQTNVHFALLATARPAGSHAQATARFEPARAFPVQTGFGATTVDTAFTEQHTAPVTDQPASTASSVDEAIINLDLDPLDDDLVEDLALATV